MVHPRDGPAEVLALSLIGVGVLDLRYRNVDVFSRRALQGNGLVVVLDAEHLSTAVMQQRRTLAQHVDPQPERQER